MSQPRRLPVIFLKGETAEERTHAFRCTSSLNDMQNYFNDFKSAVQLFNFSSDRMTMWGPPPYRSQAKMFRSWVFLAARDGGMSINHFAKSMGGVDYWSRRSPRIADLVDNTLLKAARKLLREKFSSIEQIRHAVAHSAEITSSQKWLDQHSFNGPIDSSLVKSDNARNVVIRENLVGNKLIFTWEGKVIEYEISWESVSHLEEVLNLYFEGFSSEQSPS